MRGDDLFHLEFYTIIHPQRKTGQELKPGPEPAGRSQCRGHGEVLFTGLLFVSVSALLFVCLFFFVFVYAGMHMCVRLYIDVHVHLIIYYLFYHMSACACIRVHVPFSYLHCPVGPQRQRRCSLLWD